LTLPLPRLDRMLNRYLRFTPFYRSKTILWSLLTFVIMNFNLNIIVMKKLDFPDEYYLYHNNQEELFVLDKANMEAITKETYLYQSYMKIPEDKDVECFVVEYDQVSNSYKPNFGKKVRVKMKLLEAHLYGRSFK